MVKSVKGKKKDGLRNRTNFSTFFKVFFKNLFLPYFSHIDTRYVSMYVHIVMYLCDQESAVDGGLDPPLQSLFKCKTRLKHRPSTPTTTTSPSQSSHRKVRRKAKERKVEAFRPVTITHSVKNASTGTRMFM